MYFFFLKVTATTEIYTYGPTLSLHDALPIGGVGTGARRRTRAILSGPERDRAASIPVAAGRGVRPRSRAGRRRRGGIGQGRRRGGPPRRRAGAAQGTDRKSTRLNSSH